MDKKFLEVDIQLEITNVLHIDEEKKVEAKLKVGDAITSPMQLSQHEYKLLAYRVSKFTICDVKTFNEDEVRFLYGLNVPILASNKKSFYLEYYKDILNKLVEEAEENRKQNTQS